MNTEGIKSLADVLYATVYVKTERHCNSDIIPRGFCIQQ